MPIRLSAEVLEYLKEGIENATGCEDSDVDHNFANELERLMTRPLYTEPLANYPEVEWGPMVVAPLAGEAQPSIMRFNPISGLDMNPASNGLYVRYEDHAAILSRTAAPQASEALRILFPTHLRKMWSGAEVQAWFDEQQGIPAPQTGAKGSFGLYRQWQEQQSDLKEETVRRSQEKSNER